MFRNTFFDLLVDDNWRHIQASGLLIVDMIMVGWTCKEGSRLMRRILPHGHGRRVVVEAAYEGLDPGQIKALGYDDDDLYVWQWHGFFRNPMNMKYLSSIRILRHLDMYPTETDGQLACIEALVALADPQAWFEAMLDTSFVIRNSKVLFNRDIYRTILESPFGHRLFHLVSLDEKKGTHKVRLTFRKHDLWKEAVRGEDWDIVCSLVDDFNMDDEVDYMLETHATLDAYECFYTCGGSVDEDDLLAHMCDGNWFIVNEILAHQGDYFICDTLEQARLRYNLDKENMDDAIVRKYLVQ